MKKLPLLLLLVLITSTAFAKEYHVSVKGNDSNDGSAAKPFKTISEAVKHAYPGDIITVHEGVYREWVNPLRGGESDAKRIVYRAAPGEKAEIKGSEVITGWKKVKEGVWKVTIENTFFKDYNPYKDSIHGDWFNDLGWTHHTGEVFLNGKSLYEQPTLEQVMHPVAWKRTRDKKGSLYTWYCKSDENNTTIWANFHEFNPNRELVEISVRKTCFYPEKEGINYITIRGFHISQAATQWAPPTAEQIGMVAIHWNKGWIIEDNVISNSKCSGITLGKDRNTGQNVWSAEKDISGAIHYIETTFRAIRHGWNKEQTGSHIVRNNEIFACEQTGICGSMGAAFCTIENNHIHDIWSKRQFEGAEIGGIKFHAAIDAVVRKNRVHGCGRGMWFDWMTQGTRISGNLFYDNDLEDLFLEVNHGPFLVDNNIMLSPSAIKTESQGGAFVQNLIAGTVYTWGEVGRYTPYHFPHTTEIKGLAFIYSGDDRYYNNVFIGPGREKARKGRYRFGTEEYNNAKFPVFIDDNVYYHGARPCYAEDRYLEDIDFNPDVRLEEKGDEVYLHIRFDPAFYSFREPLITTELLGESKISKAGYENADGTPLVIDRDYSGNTRTAGNNLAGPFSGLKTGEVTIKVW